MNVIIAVVISLAQTESARIGCLNAVESLLHVHVCIHVCEYAPYSCMFAVLAQGQKKKKKKWCFGPPLTGCQCYNLPGSQSAIRWALKTWGNLPALLGTKQLCFAGAVYLLVEKYLGKACFLGFFF